MKEKQLRYIPSAVYLGDNTSMTRDIVRNLKSSETFDVQYIVDDPNEVEALMRDGKILFGLIIPQNFTNDIKNFKSPKLTTVIDGTQLSPASFTKIASSELLMTIKAGAMMSTYQGKLSMSETEALNTAMPINIVNRLIGNPTRNYINFLLPGMMLAIVQVAVAMNAASSKIVKKSSGIIDFFKNVMKNLIDYGILGIVSAVLILAVQHYIFDVSIKASYTSILLLLIVFMLAVVSMSLLIASIFSKKQVFATQVAAVWFIPSSILSGYSWPLISMPDFFRQISSFMPYTYFVSTLRNLMLKGHSYDYKTNIAMLIILTLGSLILSLVSFVIRKQILKRNITLKSLSGRKVLHD
jgi:ABC-2 type transport system permease protein